MLGFNNGSRGADAALAPTLVRTPSARAVATGIAVVAGVALPQAFHLAGAALGVGGAIGQTFLPMFLPVFMVGLLAGPVAGGVAGVLAPLTSLALTGMPAPGIALTYVTVELAVCGAVCGLLAPRRMPTVAKVLVSQVCGWAAVLATFVAFALAGGSLGMATLAAVGTVIVRGVPGLVLQWTVLPLVVDLACRSRRGLDE